MTPGGVAAGRAFLHRRRRSQGVPTELFLPAPVTADGKEIAIVVPVLLGTAQFAVSALPNMVYRKATIFALFAGHCKIACAPRRECQFAKHFVRPLGSCMVEGLLT